MSRKPIAVKGLTISVIPPATGSVSIISAPSFFTKVGGKGVYRGPLMFRVTNVRMGPMGTAKPGMMPFGVIMPTAKSTKAEYLPVIREGDKIMGLVAPDAMMPGAPSPIPSPITFGVQIKSAGQSSVKAQ